MDISTSTVISSIESVFVDFTTDSLSIFNESLGSILLLLLVAGILGLFFRLIKRFVKL